LIYTDSLVFTFATAIIEHGLGLNSGMDVCGASILLCIAFYLSTKLFIYYFLVEKVVRASIPALESFITDKHKYIVRAVSTPRFKSKLWCFNVFGLLCVFQLLSLSHRRLTMSSAVLCYRRRQFRLPCGVLQRRRHLHYRPSIQICDATHNLRRGAEFLSHPSLCHPSTKTLLLQELA
jgi:hypothetical protein